MKLPRENLFRWIKKFVNNGFYNTRVNNLPALAILESMSKHRKNEHLHNNHQMIMTKLFWLEKVQEMQEERSLHVWRISFCDLI